MGVPHSYRRFALRAPRIVMRARGAASRRAACLLVPYRTLARLISQLKHFAPRGRSASG